MISENRSVTAVKIEAQPDAPADQTTLRIQSALDLAKDGPVLVILGAGRHVCGGLRLSSDTELHLAQGAVLAFLPDYGAYAQTETRVMAEESTRGMIVAHRAQNITLSGPGRIDCAGAQAFSIGEDLRMGTLIPARLRPRVLVLDGCRNVRLTGGLTVTDSPMWTLHLIDCADVEISDTFVDNNRRMPNTDGLVIDGCRNVTVTGSSFRTADDGIVLKTSARTDGAPASACENILVRNCVVESRSCALKLGTESFADFTDIVFEDCRVEASNRALGLFSRDGGAMRNVRFSRIHVDCEETPDGFWGSGEALTVTALTRRDSRPAGEIRGLVVEDITGRHQGAINLWAEWHGLITDLRLRNITLTQQPGALGTAQSLDLRPTPADLEANPDAPGRPNAWRLGADGRVVGLIAYEGGMPGVFAHNVVDLALEDIHLVRPTPLPDCWNPELIVETSDS